MHECTSVIICSFHIFQRTLFNKGVVVERGGRTGVLKERMKTNRGRGGVKLKGSLCSLCEKNCLIFQLANRVPCNKLLGSSWKFHKKGVDIFLIFFYIWTCKYFYCCYRLYICVKNIAIFYVEFTKKIIFFSLFTPQFFIPKFIRILDVKWTEMNKEKQVKNLKFWVNILFEWPQSPFAATKIYISIFNLTHSLTSLMGSFHFLHGKYFSQLIDKFLKFEGMEYLNHLC